MFMFDPLTVKARLIWSTRINLDSRSRQRPGLLWKAARSPSSMKPSMPESALVFYLVKLSGVCRGSEEAGLDVLNMRRGLLLLLCWSMSRNPRLRLTKEHVTWTWQRAGARRGKMETGSSEAQSARTGDMQLPEVILGAASSVLTLYVV